MLGRVTKPKLNNAEQNRRNYDWHEIKAGKLKPRKTTAWFEEVPLRTLLSTTLFCPSLRLLYRSRYLRSTIAAELDPKSNWSATVRTLIPLLHLTTYSLIFPSCTIDNSHQPVNSIKGEGIQTELFALLFDYELYRIREMAYRDIGGLMTR